MRNVLSRELVLGLMVCMSSLSCNQTSIPVWRVSLPCGLKELYIGMDEDELVALRKDVTPDDSIGGYNEPIHSECDDAFESIHYEITGHRVSGIVLGRSGAWDEEPLGEFQARVERVVLSAQRLWGAPTRVRLRMQQFSDKKIVQYIVIEWRMNGLGIVRMLFPPDRTVREAIADSNYAVTLRLLLTAKSTVSPSAKEHGEYSDDSTLIREYVPDSLRTRLGIQ